MDISWKIMRYFNLASIHDKIIIRDPSNIFLAGSIDSIIVDEKYVFDENQQEIEYVYTDIPIKTFEYFAKSSDSIKDLWNIALSSTHEGSNQASLEEHNRQEQLIISLKNQILNSSKREIEVQTKNIQSNLFSVQAEVKDPNLNKKTFIFLKGSVNDLILSCKTKLNSQGAEESLSNVEIQKYLNEIDSQKKLGYRCISYAYQQVDSGSDVGNRLVLLGTLLIKCKIFQNLNQKVEELRSRDISVKILTKENKSFGEFIGQNLGLTNVSLISETALLKISDIKSIDILCGAKMNSKLFLAELFEKNGENLAMTFEKQIDFQGVKRTTLNMCSINENPVVKNSSAIIIKENFLDTISELFYLGRRFFSMTQKLVIFAVPFFISLLIIMFIGSLLLQDAIFTPSQLIWICIIFLLGSYMLSNSKIGEDYVDKKIKRDSELANVHISRNIIAQIIYQLASIFVLTFSGDQWIPETIDEIHFQTIDDKMLSGNYGKVFSSQRDYLYNQLTGPSRHHSLIFSSFLMINIFNLLNSRQTQKGSNIFKGFGGDTLFFVYFIILVLLQWIIGNFAGEPFGISSHFLSSMQWLIIFLFGIGSMIYSIILRCIF